MVVNDQRTRHTSETLPNYVKQITDEDWQQENHPAVAYLLEEDNDWERTPYAVPKLMAYKEVVM